MSSVKNIKIWFEIHKWSSLICTLFLFMLCVTGLPLIFHEEIEALEGKPKLARSVPANTLKASLDKRAEVAVGKYPKKVIRFIYWDEHEPNTTTFSLSDSINAAPDNYTTVIVDDHTAELLDEPKLQEGFMYIMLQMHIDMFLGIGGKLFLGLMGLLFVVAIVSGIMLYGPIMKRFDFGMIRTERSTRLKWLDMHNLLGVVTIAWATVVGLTGVINTLSDVVLGLWQVGQLSEMTAPYKNAAPLTGKLSSLDDAMAIVTKAAAGMEPSIITYPGTVFTSKHHYAIFVRGTTPLRKRIIKPALIDAKTGKLTDMRDMPWFVNALFISEPLHFGDYGGLPLKIIWALFDIATIVVLGSGFYLWFARNKASRAHINRLAKNETEILTVIAQQERG